MTQPVVDFRSDTVTQPSAAMRQAMAEAKVGDDVYGEDPTVAALEARVAGLMGKDAAVYVPSGTQSNLLALMSHCERGDEFIAGQDAHAYKYEAGGAAVLGSIQPQPLENLPDGSIALEKIQAAIKANDTHFAPTKLLALENTIGGKVLPQDYVLEATALARRYGLATHLDGARIFNAAVASGKTAAELAEPFDSVSVCLSKGLGAPVGSVLTGDAGLIGKARRLRKMVGGGMRQAGIIAAGALYAVEHNIDRLADDHARARRLAQGLARYDGLDVVMPQTNIFFVNADAAIGPAFSDWLEANGILVSGRYGEQRWVTHLDIADADVDRALAVVEAFFNQRGVMKQAS